MDNKGHMEGRTENSGCSRARMSMRSTLAILLTAASFVFVAAYTYSHASWTTGTLPTCSGKEGSSQEDENALALPEEVADKVKEEEEKPGGAGTTTTTGTTTGQRVAGHLLAVLLLASVTAAIVEAVRARMTRSAAQKSSEASASGVPDGNQHTSNHGRPNRRATLQEKSYSYDGYMCRIRSSSAGVGNYQIGTSASAAAATFRTQKAMKVRLGGRVSGTPPLLRRSSFPVMSRTTSRVDSNGGSPALGSRKPSISEMADDEMGDFQKKRVRLIRRF